jgi:hypothetical protein
VALVQACWEAAHVFLELTLVISRIERLELVRKPDFGHLLLVG